MVPFFSALDIFWASGPENPLGTPILLKIDSRSIGDGFKSSEVGKSPKTGSGGGARGALSVQKSRFRTKNHYPRIEASAEPLGGPSGPGMAPGWRPGLLGPYFLVLVTLSGFLGAERGDFRRYPRFRKWATMSQNHVFFQN